MIEGIIRRVGSVMGLGLSDLGVLQNTYCLERRYTSPGISRDGITRNNGE